MSAKPESPATFDEWARQETDGKHRDTDDSMMTRMVRRCWDAATAAERERCHTHAARALDSATEGKWADAAVHLLAISRGDAA